MQITIDRQAKAVYIRLKTTEVQKGEVKTTKKISDSVLADYDENEKTIGIELLHLDPNTLENIRFEEI